MTGTVTRREVLTAGTALVAGCLGSDEEAPSLASHPASDGLERAPTLGPAPADAAAVVVAFEDPSCDSCAAFSDSTFPKLRTKAIDDEDLSYAWRGVPSVEPWGRPATRALWAVHERDPAGFWALKEEYYDNRDAIDMDNLIDTTQSLLTDADIDADWDAVVNAIRGESEDIRDRIDTDEAAAEACEIATLPGFVLFRDGSYVTTVVGNQPYGVFEGALEL